MDTARKIGANIEKQMQQAGTGLNDLAKAIGVTRQTLFNYIKGNSAIDSVRLLNIAKYFEIEPSELLNLDIDEYSVDNQLLFRSSLTQQDSESKVLDRISKYLALYNQTFYQAKTCCAFIPAYYNVLVQYQSESDSLNEQYAKLKMTEELKASIERFARLQRKGLGLNEFGAIPAIEAVVATGVHIIFLDFESDDVFGVSTIDKKYGSFIIVNDNEQITLERKIFTIFHEYAHLLLHHPLFERKSREVLSDTASKILDRMADYFAGCFLCPKEYLEDKNRLFAGNWSFENCIKVKYELQISFVSLIMSLFNQKYISKTVKDQIFNIIKENGFEKQEVYPLKDFSIEDIKRICQKDLMSALFKLYEESSFSAEDAMELLQCSKETIENIFVKKDKITKYEEQNDLIQNIQNIL